MCLFMFQNYLVIPPVFADLITEEDPIEKGEASLDMADFADVQIIKFLIAALALQPDQIEHAAQKFEQKAYADGYICPDQQISGPD